jgi:ribokinase
MAGGVVTVVGSINVDLVVEVERLPARGETVTGGTFARRGGGKGANQAVAAARAGAPVRMVGAVGDDDFGRVARAELAAEGIDVAAVGVLADAPTGVALISVDAAGENQIAVASGANLAMDAEWVARELADGPAPAGGVLLLGHEVADEVLAAAAGWGRDAGQRIVLDPAPARPLASAVRAAGPLLTPNLGEARALTGEEEPAAAARALAVATGAPVVVTLGADGVLVDDGRRAERRAGVEVTAVDATGAGDVFTGSLAAALAGGSALDDAVGVAQRAAAQSVTTRGARAA